MHRHHQSVTLPRQDGLKPTLPMIQLPIYRVRQRDLEAYLGRVYRLEHFDFHEATGITPGMCPEYVVSPTTPLAYHAQQEADRLRRGRKSGNIALILHVLCADGYIPVGRYIIDTHPEPPPAQVYRSLLAKTGDPGHPECVAFRRDHRKNRAFTQLAGQMDRTVQERRETP